MNLVSLRPNCMYGGTKVQGAPQIISTWQMLLFDRVGFVLALLTCSYPDQKSHRTIAFVKEGDVSF